MSQPLAEVKHTRNCAGRRRAEKAEKEGKDANAAYKFEVAYLYREIKSEATRAPVIRSNRTDLAQETDFTEHRSFRIQRFIFKRR